MDNVEDFKAQTNELFGAIGYLVSLDFSKNENGSYHTLTQADV